MNDKERIAELEVENKALRVDAERYRWLRTKNWQDGGLCVVTKARETVRLGTDCPSHDRLDAAIDAALLRPERRIRGERRTFDLYLLRELPPSFSRRTGKDRRQAK